VLTHGLKGFRQLRSALEKACRSIDHKPATCLSHGEAGFAVILAGCDRQLAVRLGNQLIERITRGAAAGGAGKHSGPAIGVGAATVSMPPKNFPAKDLLQAANRCLYGSDASGGGVVKSIEIY
jgi:GGDEF domain-containing protein